MDRYGRCPARDGEHEPTEVSGKVLDWARYTNHDLGIVIDMSLCKHCGLVYGTKPRKIEEPSG